MKIFVPKSKMDRQNALVSVDKFCPQLFLSAILMKINKVYYYGLELD